MTAEFRLKRAYLDNTQTCHAEASAWDRYLLDLTLLYGEFFCHVVSQAEVRGENFFSSFNSDDRLYG